jgi:hypothetical protein
MAASASSSSSSHTPSTLTVRDTPESLRRPALQSESHGAMAASGSSSSSSHTLCGVCNVQMQDTDVWRLALSSTITCCPQAYCFVCLDKWTVQRQPSCPLCRAYTPILLAPTGAAVPRVSLVRFRSGVAGRDVSEKGRRRRNVVDNRDYDLQFHRLVNELVSSAIADPGQPGKPTAAQCLGTAFHDYGVLSDVMYEGVLHSVWRDLRVVTSSQRVLKSPAASAVTVVCTGPCFYDSQILTSGFTMDMRSFWNVIHAEITAGDVSSFVRFLTESQHVDEQSFALFSFLYIVAWISKQWPLDRGQPGDVRCHSSGAIKANQTYGESTINSVQTVLLWAFVWEAVISLWGRDFKTDDRLFQLEDTWRLCHWFAFPYGVFYDAGVYRNTASFALYFPASPAVDDPMTDTYDEKEVQRAPPTQMTLLVLCPLTGAFVEAGALAEAGGCCVVSKRVQGSQLTEKQHVHRSLAELTATAMQAATRNPNLKQTPAERDVGQAVRKGSARVSCGDECTELTLCGCVFSARACKRCWRAR